MGVCRGGFDGVRGRTGSDDDGGRQGREGMVRSDGGGSSNINGDRSREKGDNNDNDGDCGRNCNGNNVCICM